MGSRPTTEYALPWAGCFDDVESAEVRRQCLVGEDTFGSSGQYSRVRNLLEMLLVDSQKFLRLLRQIHELRGLLLNAGPGSTVLVVDDVIRQDAADIHGLTTELGLEMSRLEAERLSKFLK